MSRAHYAVKRLRLLPWTLVCALCCAGEPASAPPADGQAVQHLTPAPQPQLNELEAGLWEYTRTQLRTGETRPRSQTIRRCSDPQSEFKAKMAELAARSCTFRPMKQHGSRYEMVWSCKMEADQTISMRDVITVTGPHGYQDESDAVVPQGATHTSLSAVRVGECTAAERAAQAARTQSPGQPTLAPYTPALER